jgi:hypothetical protein
VLLEPERVFNRKNIDKEACVAVRLLRSTSSFENSSLTGKDECARHFLIDRYKNYGSRKLDQSREERGGGEKAINETFLIPRTSITLGI